MSRNLLKSWTLKDQIDSVSSYEYGDYEDDDDNDDENNIEEINEYDDDKITDQDDQQQDTEEQFLDSLNQEENFDSDYYAFDENNLENSDKNKNSESVSKIEETIVVDAAVITPETVANNQNNNNNNDINVNSNNQKISSSSSTATSIDSAGDPVSPLLLVFAGASIVFVVAAIFVLLKKRKVAAPKHDAEG